MKLLLSFLFLCCALPALTAQQTPVVPQATAENRARQYRNLVGSIQKNLSLPLCDSTEESWTDAFYAMELTGYRSAWADQKIRTAATHDLLKRSASFHYAFIELLNTNYKGLYRPEIEQILLHTNDPKCFAYGVEYISPASGPALLSEAVMGRLMQLHRQDNGNVYTAQVLHRFVATVLDIGSGEHTGEWFRSILPGETLMISFQRKNRDYPGIAMIRDTTGKWLAMGDSIFWVPQLARSLGNMPFYLTNGNTPQGLFRINGFDVSKSLAIGPTTNIQLMMPQETTPAYFLKDSSFKNSSWSESIYEHLLPPGYKSNTALWETFIAGKAGRSEIIAHGTTVNPGYYKAQPYYPHTPTQGCLCTRETWSGKDGSRLQSDQQKLVDALRKAGGENGYCLVIELGDQPAPVSVQELLPLLN